MQILKMNTGRVIPIEKEKCFNKFEYILIDLQYHMLNYALRLTSNIDKARDLRQETSLKVLSNLKQFHNDVNFKAWIFRIMHNLFITNYRQTSFRKIIFDQNCIIQTYLHIDSTTDNPEANYNYLEIKKVLNNLDEMYRIPFIMFLDGYSYLEIMKIMEVPLGTVKSRLSSAKKQLRLTLIDYH